MNKQTWIILGALILAFGSLMGISLWQNRSTVAPEGDHAQVFELSEDSGLPENIEGNADAPVKIYEYGDYQCTACAPTNPYINELKEEYGDNLAIVFRTTIMSYHQNGVAAASAANAAAMQGYWKEYKDLLFANQNAWYDSDAETRQTQFEEYFMRVTEGKGDLSKFREDMASDAVKKKIKFDEALASKAKVSFTPTFYVEDEFIDQRGENTTTEDFLNMLRAAIDKRLAEQGITNTKSNKTTTKDDTNTSSDKK